ncbi:MAG: hypothetical protein EON58_09135 [Alphaproteobacteria bacterium]|nr:MAG: hypothetical protein EON58_09135 [Alphaproteobacteria bacterium]
MQSYVKDMQRLAEHAVAMAQQMGVELDYSSSSVAKLDDILELLHQQLADAKPTQDQVEDMALNWGAYFGECIRRNIGGDWEFFQGSDAVKLGAEYVFVTSRALRRIESGPEESVNALYSSVERDHSN